MLDLGLAGKRALVAGSGPGLGRSCALGLSEAGALVTCVDIDGARAAAVADEIAAKGREARSLAADLRRADEAERVVASVVDGFGGIDVVVDVIGEIRWGHAVDLSDEDWDYSLDGVLRHVFNLARAAGRRMLDQGTGGAVVSVSSVSGIGAAPYHAPYGAAKAGLMALARTLAVEWATSGIRVNCVAPGAIATPRVAGELFTGRAEGEHLPSRAPFGRMGEADEVAKVVVFLASDLASYVSGQVIAVDGAATAQFVMGPMSADAIPDNAALEQPPPVMR